MDLLSMVSMATKRRSDYFSQAKTLAKKYKELEEYCPGEAVRVLDPNDIELAYKRIDLFMPPPPSEFVQQ
jgi:hypothetical protein